jgi:hypothetical protein
MVAQQRNGKLIGSTLRHPHTGTAAQKKLGLDGMRCRLETGRFKAPPAVGDQMSLF